MRTMSAAALFGILLLGASRAAWAEAGTAGADFLRIPVGARPAALGGAYDALADDAYAPAFNPAGLGFADAPGLAGTHLSYLDSVSYDSLSAAFPVRRQGRDQGGFGASLQYFSPGKTSGADAAGRPTGDFSGYYYAGGVAYGRKVSERASLGAGIKSIGASIDGTSARAYAADLGAMVRVDERLTVSGVLANLGTNLKFMETSDPLPRQFRLGAAARVCPALLVTGQGVYQDAGAGFNFGTEWRPVDPLAFRAGYQSEATRRLGGMSGLTLGMGLRYAGLELSYAWMPMGDMGSISYFSVALALGKKAGGETR